MKGLASQSLDDQILTDVSHRPWPIPDEPWVMRQTWHDLLFAHWPVARDHLRTLVPSFLEIDTFDNEAWVGVIPFRLSDVTARNIPAIPWLSSFNEVNVRTYVLHEGIPGVYFFSLDANSIITVEGANAVFHLPYFLADIECTEQRSELSYRSRRRGTRPAEFQAVYAPAGPMFESALDSLEYWLTERYCLYTLDSRSRAYRVEVHHRPWQLHQAAARIGVNTMAEAAGIRLPSMKPLLHFSRRLDVLNWSPHMLR